jgi:hypothetical protein
MAEKMPPTPYAPSIGRRLLCWFGIYLAAYLFLIWCWPGEIYDWTSPFVIPEGLLWLCFGVFGSWVDRYGELVLILAYGFYLLSLVLILAVPNKKTFWALMIAFVVVVCLSSFGSEKFGGIVIGMSDRVAH